MPVRPRPFRPYPKPAGPARESAHARGYSRRWREFAKRCLDDVGRERFPRGGPLCRCGQAATEVDHVRPHKGDHSLFWDPANLQSLCKSCHSRKTATEDGGFGRPTTDAVGREGD